MMATASERPPELDPRIERSRRVIAEAAIAEMAEAGYGSMTIDESAPPRVRVTQLLTWLADFLGDESNPVAACMPMFVSAAQYDPAVREFDHRFTNDRRQVLIDILVDGQTTGDFAIGLDPDLTAELLVGPIFYRMLMSGRTFPVGTCRH